MAQAGARPGSTGAFSAVDTALSVGIVLVNWNRGDLVAACLESVQRSHRAPAAIVVVDNGSTDGSPARLRDAFPDVTLIECGRNLGFAGASNVGIRWLLDAGIDAVLLLNDDTEISASMLDTLVQALAADDRIGIVGPTIYYFADDRRIWFAGGSVDHLGRADHPGADTEDLEPSRDVTDVDYISGCALLVRRTVLDQIGLLDERFFAYYEETEFCARASAHGYRVAHVPRAAMWHKVRPGDRPNSPLYLYLMARNRLLYLHCTGAGMATLLAATADVLRTAASWTLRPRHRAMRRHAHLLVRAVSDFYRRRFGAPPPAVLAARR